ncbi:hypothetical protein [Spirulina major]|uniref:hypothetical protein n=1 Tax=Spirulina major TaxID=270636 RepID=UPI000934B240|nr:hypothetical protein [Spirulina major]
MRGFIQRVLALSTIVALPLTTFSATASEASRYRREYQPREFQQCAFELSSVEVVDEQAKVACAMALEPTDFSGCVAEIDTFTDIPAQNALYACFRVRRPVELAACVVDIDTYVIKPQVSEVENVNEVALSALDHCRRSLLPLRYSACVVGLSAELSLKPENAIASCLDAEDFPREIYTPATNDTLGTDL